MTKADIALNEVYEKLGLVDSSDKVKYKNINEIVGKLQKKNDKEKFSAMTTGTISERLCELALKTSLEKKYKRVAAPWNWMADFSIQGHPFNILVSVKSFKAKERLLVSGSGNILSPTVGWGLMDDADEWTEQRTRIYLYRSFIAIYLPAKTYLDIKKTSKSIRNINGKPFLRKMENFMADLKKAVNKKSELIDVASF